MTAQLKLKIIIKKKKKKKPFALYNLKLKQGN